ncbi:hypothetical protein [Neobacillus niacini]|nr:hypothetical protein [Neobacillus niacini]
MNRIINRGSFIIGSSSDKEELKKRDSVRSRGGFGQGRAEKE